MDTIELIRRSKQGDKEARNQVITENVGLVWSTVRRFTGRGYDPEDLFQIGVIGLIKAIDKFDLSFDVRFSTYAIPMITGEIKRFLRDDGMIKVSRTLKETATRVRIMQETLERKLGREPTLDEISEEMQEPQENIVLALEAGAEVESLNKTVYQGDGNPIYLMDKIRETKDENERVLNHLALKEMLEKMGEKEQRLIKMRYFMNKTQTDIAREMGISQVQVSRLEKKILETMRQSMI
ncbi:RNA polymerase sporulation sigma factor SigF [Anaerolentibacter hominis]|uniref:RNA polymerase sporulation sigma factor SigF n=1 Tax=Anaerolentibacter hominis TaxID=3079009 RepID=UPI0031B83F7E